jgi:signal transduction histidine kinase
MARFRSGFVSGVSHELKTPLTLIRMYGEMLDDDPDAPADERLVMPGSSGARASGSPASSIARSIRGQAHDCL